MTNLFFPKSSKQDIFQSLLVVIFLILLAFLPTILNYPGYFTETNSGLKLFLFFGAGSLILYWKYPYQTHDRISEAITIPSGLIFIFWGGFVGAWLSMHVLNFDKYAVRIILTLFSSVIEFISIFHLPLYMTLIIYYFIYKLSSNSTKA